MIDREQLVRALAQLEPLDRDVLDHSLRRRIPEDLAEILEVPPAEVARLRADAVQRLSDDLDVKGGEDLGHLLKQLLDAETWDMLPATDEPAGPAEEAAEPAADPAPLPPAQPAEPEGHPPLGASEPTALADESLTPEEPRRPETEATPPPEPEATPSPDEPQREPVLGMLTEAERPRSAAARGAGATGAGEWPWAWAWCWRCSLRPESWPP